MAGIEDLLSGIKIGDLSPADLAKLKSALSGVQATVDARAQEIQKTATAEVFKTIGELAAAEMTTHLAWTVLPSIIMKAAADGKSYVVDYYVEAKKATTTTTKKDGTVSKRTTHGVDSGDITINKIGQAKGAIFFFKDNVTGKDYDNTDGGALKELVKDLIQPADSKSEPGKSEALRCWDLTSGDTRKGISASDIVTRYHAGQVTLTYQDGSSQTVEEAVKEMQAARQAAVDAAAKAPVTDTTTPPPPAVTEAPKV